MRPRQLRKDRGRGRSRNRSFSWRPVDICHWRDKPVTAPLQGLDKDRIFRGVGQHFAKPADGRIQAMVKVNEGIAGPKPAAKLLARDNLSGPFEKNRQNLKW